MTDPDIGEFVALSETKRKRPPCPVASVLDALDDEQAAKLAHACAQPVEAITNAAISKWLVMRGQPELSSPAITAHRHRKCRCHG